MMDVLLEVSSIFSLDLSQGDYWALDHLPKALLPWSLGTHGWPALESVVVVPHFFYSRNTEATMHLGTLNCSRKFLVASLRSFISLP